MTIPALARHFASPLHRSTGGSVAAGKQAQQQRLPDIVQTCDWLMRALSAANRLNLPAGSWCIGAGAIRNLVWDKLHGHADSPLPEDIDLVYFDGSDLSADGEAALQHRLCDAEPDLPWEVTNQARVHLWYEQVHGVCVAPFATLEESIASWPEYATAVGVTMDAGRQLSVLAPHGLDDLFSLRVRHNPQRASAAVFSERIQKKRFAQRWPLLQLIPAIESPHDETTIAPVPRNP